MILYMKPGPDGQSAGDCPFAHYVRIVLNEKQLPHEIRPCTPEKKPSWLMDHYEGKMPALRHRSECYVESDVIAEYLDFFFQNPPLKPSTSAAQKQDYMEAMDLAGDLFPAVARYLKHTPDGDDEDLSLQNDLTEVLTQLEHQLTAETHTGPFFSGSGEMLTLLDCSLAPKLFHMQVGLKHFKQDSIDIQSNFPALSSYMESMFERQSFQDSLYPEETVVWGWSNARS